ncbi:MAG: hypothetical protein ACKOA1_07950, partial [Bacteroidota bacterium]
LESGFLEQVERFLVVRRILNDSELYNRLSMQVYSDRGLSKNYKYAAGRHLESTEQTAGGDRWYQKYEAARSALSFDSRHQSRKKPLAFAEVMDALDAFYLAGKLRHACEIINARNVLGIDAELRLMDEVRSLSDQHPFKDDSAIKCYRLVYDSLVNPDDETFVETFSGFMKVEGSRFSYSEQRELFQYLKNYCIKKLNTGRTDYTRRLFEIHELNLSDKKLLADEPMSPFEFKNIVTIALRLGETDWVKNFIPSHLEYLSPEHRHNADVYNQANYHYFCKDYKTTFKLLQKVEFTDVFYALDARSILLKSCFEQREEELFAYQASAFRTYLSRNRRVSEYQRTIYRNFIRFASMLLKAEGDTQSIKRIEAEMETVKQIADLRWLREQAATCR